MANVFLSLVMVRIADLGVFLNCIDDDVSNVISSHYFNSIFASLRV
jgi:hypothetical protein